MKQYGFYFRNILRLLLILAFVTFVTYSAGKPYDMTAKLCSILFVYLFIRMFPGRWRKWKRSREIFSDNLSVFRSLEQRFSDAPRNFKVKYLGGESALPAVSQEAKLAEALLNYVREKDYTDDEPYVKIQRTKLRKGIKLTLRCTWYEQHIFYLIPEEGKGVFENFRFDKAVALYGSWYVLEGFRL